MLQMSPWLFSTKFAIASLSPAWALFISFVISSTTYSTPLEPLLKWLFHLLLVFLCNTDTMVCHTDDDKTLILTDVDFDSCFLV